MVACRLKVMRTKGPSDEKGMPLNDGASPVRFDQIPTAAGLMTRLAYARAKTEGIDLKPLLNASGFTENQVEDPHLRVEVRDQIRFLNLVADALNDEFLGSSCPGSRSARDRFALLRDGLLRNHDRSPAAGSALQLDRE